MFFFLTLFQFHYFVSIYFQFCEQFGRRMEREENHGRCVSRSVKGTFEVEVWQSVHV